MTQTYLPSKVLYIKYLINKNVIYKVFLYWPSYRANTPVTGPIRNHLIDNVIV